MAVTIAQAYVQLLPSMRGFGSAASRQARPELEQAGREGGRVYGERFQGGFTSAVKGLAAVATGVVAAIGAITLGGGINRALQIEQAKAKLTGLGHDAASTTTIMDNALASVLGTAYGLDEAATVAATMVASGVKEGSALEGVLKSVADVATISGRSMESVGLIYSGIVSKGKIQGDDILQLAESGIPVIELLSKTMGVSTAKVRDMVKAGQVGFPQFLAAMQSGMGGAALASGKTFTGSLANLHAALNRLGANLATPALNMLKGIFNDLRPAIDKFNAAITPLVNQLADRLAPVVDRLSKRFSDWLANVDFKALGGTIRSMSGVLVPLGLAFAALGGSGLSAALGPLGGLLPTISGPIALVAGAIAAMVANSKPLQDALGGAVKTIGEAFKDAGPDFVPFLQALTRLMEVMGTLLAPVVRIVADVLAWAIGVLGDIAKWATPYIKDFTDWLDKMGIKAKYGAGVFGDLKKAWEEVYTWLSQTLWPWITNTLTPGLGDLESKISVDLLPALKDLNDYLKNTFGPTLDEFKITFATFASVVLPIMLDLTKNILPDLKRLAPVVAGVFGDMGGIIAAVMSIVLIIVRGVLLQIHDAWKNWGDGITKILRFTGDAIVLTIANLVEAVRVTFEVLLDLMKGDWKAAGDHITKGNEDIAERSKRILGDIVASIITFSTTLWANIGKAWEDNIRGGWEIGISLIRGIIKGIEWASTWLDGAMKRLAESMPEWLKTILLVHSPSLVMFRIGAEIPKGLALGIEHETPAVGDSMTKMLAIPGKAPQASATASEGSRAAEAVRLHPDDIATLAAAILAGATRASLATVSATKWADSQQRQAPGRTH